MTEQTELTSTMTKQTGTEEINLINKTIMLNDLTYTRGGGRVKNSAEDILTLEHNLETFTESIAKSFAGSISNKSAIMFSESIASCSAESIINSDSLSSTKSAFHAVNIACEQPFAVQFIESSGNDCLKTKTDFDEAFAEAFTYTFD